MIVVPPQNITVNITQDAFLACQAEAYPGNLTYSWFQGSSNVYHLRYTAPGAEGVAQGQRTGAEWPLVGMDRSFVRELETPHPHTHPYLCTH